MHRDRPYQDSTIDLCRQPMAWGFAVGHALNETVAVEPSSLMNRKCSELDYYSDPVSVAQLIATIENISNFIKRERSGYNDGDED